MAVQFLTNTFDTELATDYENQLVTPSIVQRGLTGNPTRVGQNWYARTRLILDADNLMDDPQTAHATGQGEADLPFEHEKGDYIKPVFLKAEDMLVPVEHRKVIPVAIDGLDAFATSLDLTRAVRDRAIARLNQTTDRYVFRKILEEPSPDVIRINAAGITDAAGLREAIREAKVRLSQNNVPRTGRYIVFDPDIGSLAHEIVKDRQTDYGDLASLQGFVGQYDGFTLFESNNLGPAADTVSGVGNVAVFGHVDAVAYNEIFADTNVVDYSPRVGGMEVHTWRVYGGKVFTPSAIGIMDVPDTTFAPAV